MPQTTPDPGRVLGMITGFEQTAAMLAALDVGLFTAVAEGAGSAAALSASIGCPPRATRMLADVLCAHGLLTKIDGVYGLAADAALYLDGRSPAYIGDAARFLASSQKLALCLEDPEGWMRRGGPAHAANTAANAEVWVDFARGMGPMMAPAAENLARALKAKGLAVRRILDVAAGHGLFGVEAAKAFPEARVVALDWAAVLEVAKAMAAAAGVGGRFETLVGDAFTTPLGRDYDLILIPNFLHHFDRKTCVGFLSRAADALAPGGKLAIVEYVVDEERISPPAAALFTFSMLTATPAGETYTRSELTRMCAAAGLGAVVIESLPSSPQTLVMASRPE
jgi:ubiquinone/menaquinone biosynthesis C-methylase UbiE